MKNNPLISIVTVVYNAEAHLRDCIRSVREQDYKNIEYIIIDGGSTDNTLNIIKENEDLVTKWISEKDNGISDAFNKGIKLASGDIIGILNADDMYMANAIRHIAEAFMQSDNKPGIYYGDARLTYFDDKYSYDMVPQIANIWKYMSIYHPACFVTADVYRQHGLYSTEIRYAMDADFVHRCLVNGVNFIHVQHTLTYFRSGGASDKNMYVGYKEFYDSIKRYNPAAHSQFNFWKGVLKAMFMKTALGKQVHKNKKYFKVFLTSKVK